MSTFLSFQNKNKDTYFHDFFKTSSNITGLSTILTNESEINQSKKPNISFETNTSTNFNPYKNRNYSHDKYEKINLVKNILNKPLIKPQYDGYAVLRKKFTIEYLLQKSLEKEEKTIFEENKLCKNNYPLIKFLSNRKIQNNSNNLLFQTLNIDNNDLTIFEKKEIKNLISNSNLRKNRTNLSMNEKKSQKELNTTKLNQSNLFYFQKRNDINNYININEERKKLNLTQSGNEYFNINKNFERNLKDLVLFNNNNRADTQRIYPVLGYGETIRLDNHDANRKNNDILLNRNIRKNMNYKNNRKDFINNDIIKDVSKLKLNNKIMNLNTRMLAI